MIGIEKVDKQNLKKIFVKKAQGNSKDKIYKGSKKMDRICFTINNYDESTFKQLDAIKPKLKRLLYAKEIGETRGVPHLQGFALLKEPRTFRTIVTKYFPGAHIEEMRGSVEENVAYCSKQTTPIDGIEAEIESIRPIEARDKFKVKQQGKRNDIHRVRGMLEEGKNMGDIVNEATSYQSVRFAETYLKYKPLSLLLNPKGVIGFDGETGIGKSAAVQHLVRKLSPKDVGRSSSNLNGFDGYTGQKVAIIDDFTPSHCEFGFLLKLLDRYPLRVPVKGGFVEGNPEQILITSNYTPSNAYGIAVDHKPLIRRVMQMKVAIEWQTEEQDGEQIKVKPRCVTYIHDDKKLCAQGLEGWGDMGKVREEENWIADLVRESKKYDEMVEKASGGRD